MTLTDLGRLLKEENQNTLYKKIQRLKKTEWLIKISKGKYYFALNKPDDFTMANFIYQPSYVSLESALSFYGIITAFPYQITSITPKKTKRVVVGKKEYTYTQINQDLFWGYEKTEKFLIADREKSLLDYLYLASKGLRSPQISEFDLKSINRQKIKDYLKMIKKESHFAKFLKKIKI